ncbi:MAG: hypothetical protein IMZ46_15360, partial [Acidobacteria bacterium]|nr:hypothetical protein [Acidobacteriota bacterium]
MSLRNRFAKSVDNYIAASRVIQGGEEFDAATPEEREAVLTQWNVMKVDLKAFYALKIKEAKENREAPPLFASAGDRAAMDAPRETSRVTDLAALLAPRSRGESGAQGWRGKGRDWKKNHIDVRVQPQAEHDGEFEHAIQTSVRETSRGDAAEDAAVERAIRQSVGSLRGRPAVAPGAKGTDVKTPMGQPGGSSSVAEEIDLQITDEEYQALIEKAMRESMVGDAKAPSPSGGDEEELERALERSRAGDEAEERDEELRRAIEASRAAEPVDDEELKRAIEASERMG